MTTLDPHVCTECIDDSGIRDFMESKATEGECSFCDSQSTPVALLDDITEHMRTSLFIEYDDANDWLISDEGDYNLQWWDAWDLLTEEVTLELPNDSDGRLLREIVDRLPDHSWCTADPYDVSGQEKVRYDWAWFSEVVMHRRRFFFESYGREPHDDNLSPGELLETIFKYAEHYELIETLPSGTPLFRARFQASGAKYISAQELGPPPKERATQSNRMSPPGIPMFYACDIPETALRETANKEGRFTVGLFATRRPALILDLSRVPNTPTLFQSHSGSLEFRPREVLGFLNHVADEISRPIERDDRVHFNYIPTQVVTEFVQSKLARGDTPIDGIKFHSAVHQKKPSYVIFAGQENLLPAPEGFRSSDTDRWLELISVSENDVTQADIEKWKKEIPERYQRDYRQQLYGDE